MCDLAQRAPSVVAVARFTQIRLRGKFEARGDATLSSQFIGECLFLNKTVFAGPSGGALAKAKRFRLPPLDAREFRTDDPMLVSERRWTALCPFLQMPKVLCDLGANLGPSLIRCRTMYRTQRERLVHAVIRKLYVATRGP